MLGRENGYGEWLDEPRQTRRVATVNNAYQIDPERFHVRRQIDNRGAGSAPVRVLQITDTHLFADPCAALVGVNTQDSFSAVLELVRDRETKFDFILATGDLAQDGSLEAYTRLQSGLTAFGVPVYWLPGNHDIPATMRQCSDSGPVCAERDFRAGNWQVVLLDTHLPTAVGGRLNAEELQRLDDRLATFPEHHALICLHHHPVPVGSRWMDEIGLDNPDALFQVLDRHAQVRAVLWGHIHQDFSTLRNGVQLLASPSTCFQFKPRSPAFALDDARPGYRWLELHADGRVETGVQRATNYRVQVNTASAGY